MKPPKFEQGSKGPFALALHKNVMEGYFEKNKISPYGNREMHTKTIILLSLLILFYYLTLFYLSPPGIPWYIHFSACVIEGLVIAGIGFCIMHDAIHGSYSANKKLNKILGTTLNLVGGINFIWKRQHNIDHHSYTNIDGHDHDIDVPYIMRFSPNQPWYPWHRLQFLYVIPVYAVYYFLWIFLLDPIKYWTLCREDQRKGKKFNWGRLANFLISKTFFVLMWIGVPYLCFDKVPWTGLAIIGITCSIVISLIFQLAHTVQGTIFPVPDADNKIPMEMAAEQILTTSNFSPKSRALDWYLGGLNRQNEHHLFPDICHVHYRKIAPIVKDTAHAFGLPYNCNETLLGAIWSHFVFLFKMGNDRSTRVKTV